MTYVIKQLSVSKLTTFAHDQKGGCQRRSFYDFPLGLKPPMDEAQSDGDAGHALLAVYEKTGKLPDGRARMKTAVERVIESQILPAPGPDLIVEERFSGQPQRDAKGKWVQLDASKTIWLGGLPFDGFVDLQFNRDGTPTILDHKFTVDPEQYALSDDELIDTIQMPVYAHAARRRWPEAKTFRIAHNYYARDGKIVLPRSKIVTLSQVEDRIGTIEDQTRELAKVWQADSAEDVPTNTKSCDMWRGCPHQSICSAYKEKGQVKLSAEDLALFGDVPSTPAPAVEVAAVIPPDAPANDANAAPPEKAKKKSKLKIQDDSTPAPFEIAGVGTVTPTGETSAKGKPVVTTSTGERLEVGALPAQESKADPIAPPTTSAQIPDSTPMAQIQVQPVVVIFELGPKTLQLLAGLLKK